ncbi:MAG: transcription elongation factor GreA [Acholeplasmataceae bacterium]
MASKKVYELTQEGLNSLKNELTYLTEVKRKENVQAIKEAREQGDLSENADYDAARNEQAKIESRIKEIEIILKNAKVIKSDENDTTVSIGKKVELTLILENGNKKDFTYDLVGPLEANPINGKISTDSPIGKAILNKDVDGEELPVRTETGKNLKVIIRKII